MHYVNLLRQYSLYLVIVVALMAGVYFRANYGCASHIPSASGFEGIGPSDRVIFSLRPATPDSYAYGEAVVYRPRATRADDVSSDAIAIGRVVGKPGDVVAIRDNNLLRNDEVVPNALRTPGFANLPAIIVPHDTLFLINDSSAANDSRQYGPVPISLVRGAAASVGK